MDAQYEKPDFVVDPLGRITQYEMPDFIADATGRVEDVRRRKYARPQASQVQGTSAVAGGPGDKSGPDHSWPVQSLQPRVVLISIPIGLFALLGWLLLRLITGGGS